MGRLTVHTFLTLDGVMQAPGGPEEDRSGGFPHGGWLVPYFDEGGGAAVVEQMSRAEAFLLGRGTYEIFAAHWPRVTDPADPVAALLNRLPKHVVSSTLTAPAWAGSSAVAFDDIAALKRRYDGEIQVHGSAGLASSLLRTELVDELRLFVFPVVLGTGKRLFPAGALPASFELAASRTTGRGVFIGSYRRVGRPAYGSFALEG